MRSEVREGIVLFTELEKVEAALHWTNFREAISGTGFQRLRPVIYAAKRLRGGLWWVTQRRTFCSSVDTTFAIVYTLTEFSTQSLRFTISLIVREYQDRIPLPASWIRPECFNTEKAPPNRSDERSCPYKETKIRNK